MTSAGRGRSAGGALIVVVQTVEDRPGDDPSLELRRPRHRLLLGDALMWSRLVVEDDELGEEASQVLDIEQQEMVEQLAAECADEALGEGVHIRRAHSAADDAGADPFEGGGEATAELRVTVGDENLGQLVHRGVTRLLGAPVVCGRGGRCGVDDATAPEVEEEQHEDGAEKRVERLEEVAAPGHVVRDEGGPALAAADAFRPLRHVPLHGPPRDVNPELEKLAADALSAPEPIRSGHFSNDGSVAARPPPDRPRPPAPEEAKAGAVPSHHCVWVHQGHSGAPRHYHLRQVSDQPALGAGEANSLAAEARLGGGQLQPEHLVLRDQGCSRAHQARNEP